MKQLINPICKMFNNSCRHCSEESTYRPYTEIIRDSYSGLYKPVRTSKKRIDLGQYCNNYNAWVNDMYYCPVIWEKSRNGVLLAKSFVKVTIPKQKNIPQQKHRKVPKTRIKTTHPINKVVRRKSKSKTPSKISRINKSR